MAYVVEQAVCINCGKCRRECPTDTILYFAEASGKHRIDPEGCIDCDLCARVCPVDCITRDDAHLVDRDLVDEARARARIYFSEERSYRRGLEAYAAAVVTNLGPGSPR